MLQLGVRYYDPSTGRFTQLDPIGNWYAYVGGNPLVGIDPWGLSQWDYEIPGLGGTTFGQYMNNQWSSYFDGRAYQAWRNDPQTQARINGYINTVIRIGKAITEYFIPFDEIPEFIKFPNHRPPGFSWKNRCKVFSYVMDLRFGPRGSKGPAKWGPVKGIAKGAFKYIGLYQLIREIGDALLDSPLFSIGEYDYPEDE